MSIRLLRAVPDDIPELVDLYFTAFKSLVVLRVKPDVLPVREWFSKGLERDFDEPHTRVYKVVDASAQEPDKIIAFAKWIAPHPEPLQEKPFEWPVDGDVELFKEIVAKATEKKRTVMGRKEHWCT
jgi:hypothetical protein